MQLDRTDIHAPSLTEALTRRFIGAPASPYPQRGGHTSTLRGASPEFSEHTEYSPGDDIKSIDWKAFAKTDRYYVKRYEDERLSRSLIVVDCSNSMTYGSAPDSLRDSKFQLAARVTLSLMNALLRQGDAAGLILASPAPFVLSPRPGLAQLDAGAEVLLTATVGGDASLAPFALDAAQRLGRHGSLYLIGDFLKEGDETLTYLAGVAQRDIEAKLIHVLHPDETGLPFDRVVKFLDLETVLELTIDPDAVRKAYIEEMAAFVEGVKCRARELGAGYALVRDEEEAILKLPRLLSNGGSG